MTSLPVHEKGSSRLGLFTCDVTGVGGGGRQTGMLTTDTVLCTFDKGSSTISTFGINELYMTIYYWTRMKSLQSRQMGLKGKYV